MAGKSVQATDRSLSEWFTKINTGEIKLPRFQRYEAWDRRRIAGLLTSVVNNLPLGITLILNVGDEPQFIDRYLETAPETGRRVIEHLLDGQQRLTAFWRAIHNNYEGETYYIYIPEFDINSEKLFENMATFCQTRWKKNGRRFPIWADNPSDCFKRGLIPASLLRPGDIQKEADDWIEQALEGEKPLDTDPNFPELLDAYYKRRESLKDKIIALREVVAHYNLPFLALPSTTLKETALTVFINMNTNSKPLTLYDIIVAEVEIAKGASLHDLEDNLDVRYSNVKHYFDLSDLILSTSALIQNKFPSQRGMIEMDKSKMVENWNSLGYGLSNMALFLEGQGIYDRQRLPTNAVLAVIAALYTTIPESGDFRGKAEILLKKYLWSSFFTDRYENSAPTNAYYDYAVLRNILTSQKKKDGSAYKEEDVPVLNRLKHELATEEELVTVGWPKQENIRGRGILAVASLLGSYDFADGQKISRDHLRKREYHHIYPDALLKEAKIGNSYLALNCALITNTTNRDIGRKSPLEYLKDRYAWTTKERVHERLSSHLIPIDELSNGGYDGLDEKKKEQKIKNDFEKFLKMRAIMMSLAANKLCGGENISYNELLDEAKVRFDKANGSTE